MIHERLAAALQRRVCRAGSVQQAVLIGVTESERMAKLVRDHAREFAGRELTGRAIGNSLVHADVRLESRGECLAVKHVGRGAEARLVHSSDSERAAIRATKRL